MIIIIIKSNLKTVVRPRAQFQDASLVIEREICDVDRTCAAQFGRRRPEHVAVVRDHRLGIHVSSRVIVGTGGMGEGERG